MSLLITSPPIRDTFGGLSWMNWFLRVFQILTAVKPDVVINGDESVTLTAVRNARTQVFTAPLTAGREVTLSSVNAYSGAFFRVSRMASATGASGLDVGPGLKTLSAGEWVDVEFDGSDWIVTAAGGL